ncbi:MAG: citrate/2-methylcitrate synthase [Nanoarchaeota archaeon]
MKSFELFTKDTQALFYNLKPQPLQQMLDFDYLCERLPSVAAIVHPGQKGFHKAFFGSKEIIIPIYSTLQEAAQKHQTADVLINFASFRSAYPSSKEALGLPSLRTIVIVAEGMPERQAKELITLAKQRNKLIIGPATVGGIIAGKFRIGHAGGLMENIVKAKLYRPGSVGLVSKSGGMMNELFHIISRATDGIFEGIAIGGDRYPGSTLLDHLLRYEANPEIKLLVALGELGGKQEYEIIEAKKAGRITKPLVMWVSGTCASIFPWEVQFGHAGAKAGKEEESAQAKNKALQEAGIIVPESFEELEGTIKKTFIALNLPAKPEISPLSIPLDYAEALKQGLVRKSTQFTTTISSDRGEEPTYGTVPMSEIVEKNYRLGDVIALLWFKKKLPAYFTKCIELSILLCADHGPAVSGAHNAIVAARAGKDVISALCSGLLTIGPRFGGAIDDAARYFKAAHDQKLEPNDFVEEMKRKGILIPGIGHRVKSKRNPDQRVELLKKFARENFPATPYLNYVLSVEKITLQKAENLILNVDGCIGVLFVDALVSSKQFTEEEIKEILEIGYLNGLFALARSIGLIGHILDQKRLNEPLFRQPTEEILYKLGED